MRSAKLMAGLAIAALAAGGCSKGKQPEQNMSIDEGVPDNQVSADNADIETLPADESSATPSNQLQNGFDNPDVSSNLGNSD